VCGYKSINELQNESQSVALVTYSRQESGSLVERVAGQQVGDAWRDRRNDPLSLFPREEDKAASDVDSVVTLSSDLDDDDDDLDEDDDDDSDEDDEVSLSLSEHDISDKDADECDSYPLRDGKR